MDAGQDANDGHEVVTKKSPAIIRAKAGNGIVVVLVTKDNIFNGAFKGCHITQFYLSADLSEILCKYFSILLWQRRELYFDYRSDTRERWRSVYLNANVTFYSLQSIIIYAELGISLTSYNQEI